jgi:hypothetical protein
MPRLLILTQGVARHLIPMSDLTDFLAMNSWHIFYDVNCWGSGELNWCGNVLCSTGPYDLPLWFLRDLIIVTIFTPVIYWAIRHFKICGLIVLFAVYISDICPQISGFSVVAFLFFSVGAYFSLNKLNIVAFVNRYKSVILPIGLILCVISIITYDSAEVYLQIIDTLYVPFGVFIAFYIASTLIVRYNCKPNKLLVSSCFFIYAFHGIWGATGPISVSKYILHMVIPGGSLAEDFLVYLAAPFLTAFICITILWLGRKFCPRFTLLLSGQK